MPRRLEGGRFYGATLRTRQVAGLVVVDSLHPPGSRLPRHAHDRAYFCLNRGGTYAEEFGRRRRTCVEGMLVFHPAGEAHRQVHGRAPVRSLNVELSPEWLSQVLEFAGPLDRPVEFRGGAIAAVGARLFDEFCRDDGDSVLAIESLTCEILAAAADGHELPADRTGPPWLRDTRDLLDTCLDEPVSLRNLARAAGVHPVHFAAVFRRFHRSSVGEYVRRRRLEYARQKLADPELSLSQIAADAGFADQSHFTRAFRRFTGMTPGRYRTFLAFKTH